ncbi:MAG: c-type cytochrome [Desulfobacteraceae bacterium]|jgi:mono/diheme cytochrome c family protein
MLRILSLISIVAVVGLVVWGVITVYDNNMQVGRMWETPAVRPYEHPIPVMDDNTVPFNGGEIFLRQSNPAALAAPFDLTPQDVIAAGQLGYKHFCIQCHGKQYDGMGTVGQSFAPLPGDLRSAKVQSMPVGQLFHEISYGVPGGRQPALASTIAVENRWQIIGFVKSLGIRP